MFVDVIINLVWVYSVSGQFVGGAAPVSDLATYPVTTETMVPDSSALEENLKNVAHSVKTVSNTVSG